ncbi:MAG TPA: hypothetical protein VF435_11320 [Pyrinomonadaceae bacterium]
MTVATDYGPFTSLVATAGTIIAAAGALIMGFRRGAKWEPEELDVDRGARRVASLLTAVGLVVLWSQFQSQDHLPTLIKAAILCGVLTLVFLVVYGYIIQVYTYVKEVVVAPDQVRNVKIIGGRLTANAKETIEEKGLTLQDYFKGTAYKPDVVWTRESRGVVKQLFVLCYIGLTVAGAVTLTALALIVGLKTGT